MKQIIVMSGKGGTGKTSITAAIGMLAGDRAALADCDVDASNLHLLLRPTVLSEHRFFGGTIPMFDTRSCSLCGMCESACAWSAITIRDGQCVLDTTACEGCGVCSHVCLEGNITMTPRVTGTWYSSRSRFAQPMVHAHLGIGQENSGKLVTKTKSEAVALAVDQQKEYLLVDGPPGIGCPAIAAVSGAEEVLLVTESTKAALHDLRRLMTLLEHFALPAACIINKADLNESVRVEIHRLCEERGIPVLAEFPWMDLFPESLRQGRTLNEMSDAATNEKIERVWTHLTNDGRQS